MPENSKDNPVNFMEDGGTTVAVVGDEAYTLSDDEIITHQFEDSDNDIDLVITTDGAYEVETDSGGWLVLPDDMPESIKDELDAINTRYADAELLGYPLQYRASFRSENSIFRNGWQRDKIRPESDVGQQLEENEYITEVHLEVEVDEDGSVTVKDIGFWPGKNVEVDLD